MNLRNVGSYNIGLDICASSVGWAVTDSSGNLCHFKGKPTWGSRIFPPAESASNTRMYRSLRRRYSRRRQRLNLLQDIFRSEIHAIDPDFFARLNQSGLFPEDRSKTQKEYLYTLFNDESFTEKDYFKTFPTIYHLRKWLMETPDKADIRLIYLAFHNIVKHRGDSFQKPFAKSDSERVKNSNTLSNTLISGSKESSDTKGSLSASKVLAYEQYGEDLKLLKKLVKQCCSKQKYFQFFKGEFYSPTELHPQKYVYDKSKIDGYTKYNEIHSWSYDDFRKSVEKLFAHTEAVNDSRYHQMMDKFKDRCFLRRLKVRGDGVVPFQVHLKEMDAIIDKSKSEAGFIKRRKSSYEDFKKSTPPSFQRSMNQALRIVEEIISIAGHFPNNIFIEIHEKTDSKGLEKTTKHRCHTLKDALEELKNKFPDTWEPGILNELPEYIDRSSELDERQTLYFMQYGRSLYSGKPLDIAKLEKHEIDYIVPALYMKDDSLENKALVLRSEIHNKTDQLLLPLSVRKSMRHFWDMLYQSKLISEKKYKSLNRESVSDEQIENFLLKQFVDKNWNTVFAQEVLEEKYPDINVISINAELSYEIRTYKNKDDELEFFPKCSEINDFCYAHDALLTAEIGRFIQDCYPGIYDSPFSYVYGMQSFVKRESVKIHSGKKPINASFLIASFMCLSSGDDLDGLLQYDWSGVFEVERLEKYFNYRQCFITKMPEETTGAFWDQTIYSPRDISKNMAIPVKKDFDPLKYGAYSKEQYAYFFIYKAIKEGKETFEFAQVPVNVAYEINNHNRTLEDYAAQLALNAGIKFIEMVRSKIYKYQLIEMDSSRLYLTGKEQVRSAVQFAFNVRETRIAKALYEGVLRDLDAIDELFCLVVNSLEKYSPKLFSTLRIESWKDRFFEINLHERCEVLKLLISIGNGKSNVADTTVVGGSKYDGQMRSSFHKALNKSDGMVFIDQSVTGMFEKRTYIGRREDLRLFDPDEWC